MNNFLISSFLVVLVGGTLNLARAYDFGPLDEHLEENLTVWEAFGQPRVYIEIRRHGETIHTFSRGGYASQTRIPIASATKWVSGAIVLALAEADTFDLNEPFSTYLPAFNVWGKARTTPMLGFTLRDGIFSAPASDYLYAIDPSLDLQTSAQLIAENAPVVFIPGTQMSYGGAGMQATGAMLEVVFGKDWEALALETLLEPCGMLETTYTFFAPNPAIGGGIETTPNDYLAFLDMVMSGGLYGEQRILSSDSLDIMFTNHTAGLPVFYSPFSNELEYPEGQDTPDYAFGAFVLRHMEDGSVRTATSPGAFGAFPFVDRELGFYGVIMSTVSSAAPTWPVALRALELIEEIVEQHDAGQSDGWVLY